MKFPQIEKILRHMASSRLKRSSITLCTFGSILTVLFIMLQNVYLLHDHSEPNVAVTHDKDEPVWLRDLPQASPEVEKYWRSSFELYGSGEMKKLQAVVQPYVNDIRRLRYSLLSANHTWTSVDDEWQLINGYDKDYFAKISSHPQVHTIFLVTNFSVIGRILPAPVFYDFGGTPEACAILTSKCRAIYSNGKELLNRTCVDDLKETLVPHSVDRTLLSLGLPFMLNSTGLTPTGHSSNDVILSFINIIQNGVVTSNGEVLSGAMGIMTQRCSHSWYHPRLPVYSDDLPIYDEVLTITQQTMVWYYHNTIEDLPRIAPYLELLWENPHIKVHITRAAFHETMLEYLGINKERLVWGAVRGRVVYLPAGTTCGRPPVFNTQLLAATFRQRIQARHSKPVKQDTVIVIRRSSAERQFRNHKAVVAMLREEAEPYGLKVRIFRDNPLPPLTDYIDLFQRAKMIIGPHGAGLANLLFAQPSTVTVEGLCEMEPHFWFCSYGFLPWLCYSKYSRVSLSFRNLATVLGQHYVGVVVKDGCLNVKPSDLQSHVQFYLRSMR